VEKAYHHGNLRNLMIEKTIEMIIDEGLGSLSMRKLAAACGVSHSAPYAHFASKDELFAAVLEHITEQFAMVLKDAAAGHGGTFEGLRRLGVAYVMFFAKNPQYYHFIFSHSGIKAGEGHPYEPYDIFMSFMKEFFESQNHPHDARRKILIANWAQIHGLAGLAVMNSDGLSEEIVLDILTNNYFIKQED